MDELNKISNMITEYTGSVSKFKRGLIYDDDPNVGDTIHITAIATGFKMNLIGLTGSDFGKLIMLDKDFVYNPHPSVADKEGEIVLPEENVVIKKVGYNTAENVRKYRFNPDDKPVLILEPGQSKSELESVAAIRRAHTQHPGE